jgi:hypothetical protein
VVRGAESTALFCKLMWLNSCEWNAHMMWLHCIAKCIFLLVCLCVINWSFLEKNESHHPYMCCDIFLSLHFVLICKWFCYKRAMQTPFILKNKGNIQRWNLYWNWTTWLNLNRRRSLYQPRSFFCMFIICTSFTWSKLGQLIRVELMTGSWWLYICENQISSRKSIKR